MKNSNSSRAYNKLKDLVNEHLFDFMPEIDPKAKELYESMKYSLIAGGKRLRPVLLLAAYDMCSKPLNQALPFACAVEYIHTYSLIHDDLPAMDNDDYRRGKLTNHKVFGEDLAILAGDGLLSAAYEIMTKNMLLYLDDQEKINCRTKAAFCIAKGTGVRGMVSGQVADTLANNDIANEELVNFIHFNKTASFIKASVKAGAYLGGADKDLLNNLDTYGENLGIAFQVVDDILDVISTKEDLGHTIGKDEQQNKCTYPAVFGLEESKDKAKEFIQNARNAISCYYDNAEVLNYVLDLLLNEING